MLGVDIDAYAIDVPSPLSEHSLTSYWRYTVMAVIIGWTYE